MRLCWNVHEVSLLSYMPNAAGERRQGAQPGDLPVETVRQPELIINLRAARTLDLTLPASVLSKATRVVE